MAKGKYTIQKRYIREIDKKITNETVIIPKWVRDIQKEQERKEAREEEENEVWFNKWSGSFFFR